MRDSCMPVKENLVLLCRTEVEAAAVREIPWRISLCLLQKLFLKKSSLPFEKLHYVGLFPSHIMWTVWKLFCGQITITV